MIRKYLTLLIGIAIASYARADTECTTIANAASVAGLDSLLDAVTSARPALEESEEGLALLAALADPATRPADEQVTLFAPTNAAFEAVLAALGGEVPPDTLAIVLRNHVVVGALPSAAILDNLEAAGGATAVQTLIGDELVITTADGAIFVQSGGLEAPGAEVVTADVTTCAGVVHVVDAVLLPAAPLLSSGPGMAPAMAPGAACTAVDETATEADLTALVGAITVALPALDQGVIAAITAAEPLPAGSRATVFAPTDAAFAAAAEEFGGAFPDNENIIAQVLLNHIVEGELSAEAILEAVGEGGGSVVVQTLLGSDLLVTTAGGGLFLQSRGIDAPGAEVITADVLACAGVVHVVDAVLLPTRPDGSEVAFAVNGPEMAPGEAPMGAPAEAPDAMAPGAPSMAPADGPAVACMSVSSEATAAELTALVGTIALAAPALNDSVVEAVTTAMPVPEGSRVTIFAPTDAAFAAAAEALGGALPDDDEVIAQVLLNHIVEGELSAEAILEAVGAGGGSVVVQTLLGSDLFVTTAGGGLFVQSRGIDAPGAEVITADVPTCSGVVHVIDAVLLPTKPDGSEVMFNAMGVPPAASPEAAPAMAPAVSPAMAGLPAPATAPGPAGECNPLGETAVEAGLTTLVSLLTTYEEEISATETGAAVVNAVEVLKPVPESERVTVFAPTNEAFDSAAAEFGGELPVDAIPNVLLNHIVVGDLTADTILAAVGDGGGSVAVATLSGGVLLATTVDDSLYVQSGGLDAPGALVVTPDVITCSGPVHVIDAVLLPAFANGTEIDLGEADPIPAQDRGGVDESGEAGDVAPEADTALARSCAGWVGVAAGLACAVAMVL